jgi:hypothetical protein
MSRKWRGTYGKQFHDEWLGPLKTHQHLKKLLVWRNVSEPRHRTWLFGVVVDHDPEVGEIYQRWAAAQLEAGRSYDAQPVSFGWSSCQGKMMRLALDVTACGSILALTAKTEERKDLLVCFYSRSLAEVRKTRRRCA